MLIRQVTLVPSGGLNSRGSSGLNFRHRAIIYAGAWRCPEHQQIANATPATYSTQHDRDGQTTSDTSAHHAPPGPLSPPPGSCSPAAAAAAAGRPGHQRLHPDHHGRPRLSGCLPRPSVLGARGRLLRAKAPRGERGRPAGVWRPAAATATTEAQQSRPAPRLPASPHPLAVDGITSRPPLPTSPPSPRLPPHRRWTWWP